MVSRPPILKMRVVPPQELSLPLGSNKVLECEAGGNPAPTIHWLKNGKVIIQVSQTESHIGKEVILIHETSP